MQNKKARSVGRLNSLQEQNNELEKNKQKVKENVKNRVNSIRQESIKKRTRDKSLHSMREEQAIDNTRGMDIFDLVMDFGVLC